MIKILSYKILAFLTVGLLVLPVTAALACPTVSKHLIDYNCDQEIKIAFTGDSIARGIGDERYSNRGGYVRRVKRKLKIKATNLGDPGATAGGLLRDLERNQNKRKTAGRLINADVFFIDIGRNGYWKNESPLETTRNIQRIIEFLNSNARRNGLKTKPYIVVTTLIPTRRSYQQPYIDEVNANLRRFNSKTFPVLVEFDQFFDTSILSEDDLHPDSAGYEELAKFLRKFIKRNLNQVLERKRPDRDNDGIFNKFEKRFGTDRSNPDSDGDGILDGRDVFGQ